MSNYIRELSGANVGNIAFIESRENCPTDDLEEGFNFRVVSILETKEQGAIKVDHLKVLWENSNQQKSTPEREISNEKETNNPNKKTHRDVQRSMFTSSIIFSKDNSSEDLDDDSFDIVSLSRSSVSPLPGKDQNFATSKRISQKTSPRSNRGKKKILFTIFLFLFYYFIYFNFNFNFNYFYFYLILFFKFLFLFLFYFLNFYFYFYFIYFYLIFILFLFLFFEIKLNLGLDLISFQPNNTNPKKDSGPFRPQYNPPSRPTTTIPEHLIYKTTLKNTPSRPPSNAPEEPLKISIKQISPLKSNPKNSNDDNTNQKMIPPPRPVSVIPQDDNSSTSKTKPTNQKVVPPPRPVSGIPVDENSSKNQKVVPPPRPVSTIPQDDNSGNQKMIPPPRPVSGIPQDDDSSTSKTKPTNQKVVPPPRPVSGIPSEEISNNNNNNISDNLNNNKNKNKNKNNRPLPSRNDNSNNDLEKLKSEYERKLDILRKQIINLGGNPLC